MDQDSYGLVPQGAVNLDTVRSLHQTVVSLRTALEVSKNELKQLKEKYEEHSRCLEFADVIEQLTLENHVLRRKIIDSRTAEETQNSKLDVAYSPSEENINNSKTNELDIEPLCACDINNVTLEEEVLDNVHSNNILNEELHAIVDQISSANTNSTCNDTPIESTSEIFISKKDSHESTSTFKTKLELLSKFDVKIKVKTLQDGVFISSNSDGSSRTDSSKEREKDTNLEKEYSERPDLKSDTINIKSGSTEKIKMAVPSESETKSKVDQFGVQVRITSEDSLVLKENVDRGKSKDTMNLDVDSLSLRSMSEGDNSVFSEGATTPMDHNPNAAEKNDQENASGNESEEVDDIELIFTTDESKDMSNLQEDLVSIRETDQWTPGSASTTHSTPVLIKFHTLDPDFQPSDTHQTKPKTLDFRESLRMKRVSLPNDKDIRGGLNSKGSLDIPSRGILKSYNKSDNMLYRRSPNASTRRLDSVDSLTGDYNRLSLDHTKSSSFELGSSLDVLQRDDSVDSFYKSRLGHRFSVFAETDISKCGVSEDDLASNFNLRRNTCPNPFQYRPVSRGGPRPGLKAAAARTRPVLSHGFAPRRESSAQTDVSALPSKWTSDGYLAYKIPELGAVPRASPRRPAPRPAPPRADDARRVLLSDIGFTSMVPELSRSAEPLWKLQQAHDSPLPRYVSRGYRSPCPSFERSNDWIPQPGLYSAQGRAWRSSLPDVRRDDTVELLHDAEAYLRRSVDSLRASSLDRADYCCERTGQPYIPSEARQLRLGHAVKVITPQGRLAVGRVRYVGIAGSTAANSGVVVGAEFSCAQHPCLGRNDGTHRGRRYFLTTANHTALFVPFPKVVMAWNN